MTKEIPYKWSWVEALQAYLKTLGCDAGVEKILRNNLKKNGVTEKVIHVGKSQTTCLLAGPTEGQPLLLLHGTPGSALSWWPYIKHHRNFRIWAVDRPGFSPLNRNRPETENDMALLSAVLKEATQSQPAIIMGHSMGGGLVSRFAIDYPQNVKALVLIGASLDPDLEHIQPVQYAARKAPIKFLVNRTARNSNEELIAYPEFLKTLKPKLKELKCPVLAVHAKNDGLVPFANVAFMRKCFTQTRSFTTMEFESGGHNVHRSQYRAIMDALEKL